MMKTSLRNGNHSKLFTSALAASTARFRANRTQDPVLIGASPTAEKKSIKMIFELMATLEARKLQHRNLNTK